MAIPSGDEQKLYDLVSDYLQKPALYALPKAQRQLMTLILRKLLASSTFAVANTLDGLARRLDDALARATPVDAPPDEVPTDFEGFEEQADEWGDDEVAVSTPPARRRRTAALRASNRRR